jgi:hypothetical protein
MKYIVLQMERRNSLSGRMKVISTTGGRYGINR